MENVGSVDVRVLLFAPANDAALFALGQALIWAGKAGDVGMLH